jgi:Zn-finger nucleic acid-binding protein
MPLQQGEVRGYDFNRSVVEFTMLTSSRGIILDRSELHLSIARLRSALRFRHCSARPPRPGLDQCYSKPDG